VRIFRVKPDSALYTRTFDFTLVIVRENDTVVLLQADNESSILLLQDGRAVKWRRPVASFEFSLIEIATDETANIL
jgi:hypothetical protein